MLTVHLGCKGYFIVNDKFHTTQIIDSIKDISPKSLIFGTGTLSSFNSLVSST